MPKAAKVRKMPRPGSRARGARDPAHIRQRLEYIVSDLGSNQVARVLRVAESQPSRWRSGEERLSEPNRRRVLDLDYVMARLLELYPREVAEIWLESHNAHLGARPIDVLALRGVAPVIVALDAETEGAFV